MPRCVVLLAGVCLQALVALGLPVGSPCVTLDGLERVGLPLKHNGVCIAWQVWRVLPDLLLRVWLAGWLAPCFAGCELSSTCLLDVAHVCAAPCVTVRPGRLCWPRPTCALLCCALPPSLPRSVPLHPQVLPPAVCTRNAPHSPTVTAQAHRWALQYRGYTVLQVGRSISLGHGPGVSPCTSPLRSLCTPACGHTVQHLLTAV